MVGSRGQNVIVVVLVAVREQGSDEVPPLLISGSPSSGKTGVVVDVVRTLRLPHVYVLCSSCVTVKRLYTAILRGLITVASGTGSTTVDGMLDDSDDDDSGPRSWTHFSDKFTEFVVRLRHLLTCAVGTTYIVRGPTWAVQRVACSGVVSYSAVHCGACSGVVSYSGARCGCVSGAG